MAKKKKSRRSKPAKRKTPAGKHVSLLRRWLTTGSLAVLALLLSAQVPITQTYTSTPQSVLGDEDKQEEKREEKKEENKGSENKQEEQKKIEMISPDGVRTKSRSVSNKREIEIETADGQKIKTKIEDDGTTKIEVENGAVKLKYKVENGQVVRKAEDEKGDEVELEDEDLDELENALEEEIEDDDLSLEPTQDNKLSLTKNQVTATTDFPLSIDVTTKQLVVTTPQGQKTVAILPDQAVKNLLATGIVNAIVPQSSNETAKGELEVFDGTVKLETQNDEMIYRIRANKTHRLLGFIPMTTTVTAIVSADTGTTLSRQQSLLASIVDFLSP